MNINSELDVMITDLCGKGKEVKSSVPVTKGLKRRARQIQLPRAAETPSVIPVPGDETGEYEDVDINKLIIQLK